MLRHVMAGDAEDIDSMKTEGGADSGVVVISYSRSDVAYVDELSEFFRNEGLTVWTDKGIEPGTLVGQLPSVQRSITAQYSQW